MFLEQKIGTKYVLYVFIVLFVFSKQKSVFKNCKQTTPKSLYSYSIGKLFFILKNKVNKVTHLVSDSFTFFFKQKKD